MAAAARSSVLRLDVKPWGDETDMAKLEEAVRGVSMEGLTWGASELVPVVYGIKMLRITVTVVHDLLSLDDLFNHHLCAHPVNQFVQNCNVAAVELKRVVING